MKTNCNELNEYVLSIGTDLAIMDSLVNFLSLGIDDKFELTSYDKANLVIVISKMMKTLKNKYEKIEHILDI